MRETINSVWGTRYVLTDPLGLAAVSCGGLAEDTAPFGCDHLPAAPAAAPMRNSRSVDKVLPEGKPCSVQIYPL
jgi:hypothetical protein